MPGTCGTRAGANAHRRRGEPVCWRCREAEILYYRLRRGQAPAHELERDAQRCADLAVSVACRECPAVFDTVIEMARHTRTEHRRLPSTLERTPA